MKEIETGVDKLVSLVQKHEKITLDDAAKELGVGTVVIQEWADFLEEQGVISVEYSLSKVWLKVKTLTKKEVATKVKEYDTKKESFIRKVESSLSSLDKEFQGFDSLKVQFDKVKNSMGIDLDKVQEELEELNKYNNLKKKIDDDIAYQKAEYKKIIEGSHEQIDFEKQRFNEILKGIEIEKSKLDIERKEFITLEENEQNLKKRIEALYGILESLKNKINQQEEIIHQSEDRIGQFQNIANKIMQELEMRKSGRIAPLLELSQEQQKKINYIQDQIVKKVEETRLKLEKNQAAAREAAMRFKSFFEKKSEIDGLIKQIEEDRTLLKIELDGLKKKAITFNLVSKNADVKGYVEDLEKKFTQLDKKKYVVRKELEKLSTLVTQE